MNTSSYYLTHIDFGYFCKHLSIYNFISDFNDKYYVRYKNENGKYWIRVGGINYDLNERYYDSN